MVTFLLLSFAIGASAVTEVVARGSMLPNWMETVRSAVLASVLIFNLLFILAAIVFHVPLGRVGGKPSCMAACCPPLARFHSNTAYRGAGPRALWRSRLRWDMCMRRAGAANLGRVVVFRIPTRQGPASLRVKRMANVLQAILTIATARPAMMAGLERIVTRNALALTGFAKMGQRGSGQCLRCNTSDWYGPNCEHQCSCAHGQCNNGIDGSGSCVCPACYWGTKCDTACRCKFGVRDNGPGGNGTCTNCDDKYFGENYDIPARVSSASVIMDQAAVQRA